MIRATDGPIEVSFYVEESLAAADAAGESPAQRQREVPAALWGEIGQRIAAVFDDFTLADLVARAEAAGVSRDEPALMYFI